MNNLLHPAARLLQLELGGRGRQRPRRRHGDGAPRAHGRRPQVHVHDQGRRQVRPAREPRGHLQGLQVRDRADRQAGPRPLRELLRAHQGLPGVRRPGKAKTRLGHHHARRQDHRLQLSKPTGDFLYRLAMPATAPIPEEVAKCHTQAGEYGRYVISTGPYMIEGADKLDISSCASQKPISGFNPNTGFKLVRNPNYDPATDDTAIRESNPDRFEIGVNTNLDNIFDKIERGELEGSFETPRTRHPAQVPPGRRRSASACASTRGDRIWYMYMNLTTPPFDDVHVRKAMNLVMDLEGIQRAWGGPVQGSIPTARAAAVDDPTLTETTSPYQKAPFAGDVEAAKAEMAQSKYDTDKDGICDAPAVQGRHPHQPQLRPLVEPVADHRAVGRQDRRRSRDPRGLALGRPGRDRHAEPQAPDQLGQRLGQGLRRPVDLHGAVRRPEHPRRGQLGPGARRPHAGEGQGGRGGHPGRRAAAERGRRHRRLQPCSPARSGPTAGPPSTRSSPRRSCRGSR